MMLFYLAAQTIPNDLRGGAHRRASASQSFWRITFPLLKPGHFSWQR
jgi:ABC-type sugar transport system permease subunit